MSSRIPTAEAGFVKAVYSTTEAATYLGVNEKTVRRWTATGKLKAYTLSGRRAFMVEDLDKFRFNLEPWGSGQTGDRLMRHGDSRVERSAG